MSTQVKQTHIRQNCLQALQTIVYRRPLHPELFEIRGKRVVAHPSYELEAWIMDGSHALRFGSAGFCASELVTESNKQSPDVGIVDTFFCAGDRDYEHKFEREGVNYMTTVQTEQLSDNIYASTMEELQDFGTEVNALRCEWDDDGPCLSMIDTQRYAKEVHVQAYHMMARGGVVLRTQTIFERV